MLTSPECFMSAITKHLFISPYHKLKETAQKWLSKYFASERNHPLKFVCFWKHTLKQTKVKEMPRRNPGADAILIYLGWLPFHMTVAVACEW